MTRERAIEVLKAWDLNWSDSFTANEFEQAFAVAISALSAEPCREADDYENEIADLHNRLDIAKYDKERYKEEITTLETENKGEWIPVSERLPEKNVWVLVTVKQSGKRFQEIMRRNNYIEAWTDNIDNYTDEIIAWQPLPEPYEENDT